MDGLGAICPNCGQTKVFERLSIGGYLFCDRCGYSAREEAFTRR